MAEQSHTRDMDYGEAFTQAAERVRATRRERDRARYRAKRDAAICAPLYKALAEAKARGERIDEDTRLKVWLIRLMTAPPPRKAVLPKGQRPRCGAKCRDGHPCRAPLFKRPDGSMGLRCRMHGGASTGPRTEEGKRRSKEARVAGLKHWRERRGAKANGAPVCE